MSDGLGEGFIVEQTDLARALRLLIAGLQQDHPAMLLVLDEAQRDAGASGSTVGRLRQLVGAFMEIAGATHVAASGSREASVAAFERWLTEILMGKNHGMDTTDPMKLDPPETFPAPQKPEDPEE